MRLVICREDLPENPKWHEEGYPYSRCWDVDEFFESPLVPQEEKRRIFWECMWRLWGRYRRGRPFFEAYMIEDSRRRRVEDWRWVCRVIIASARIHKVVPPGRGAFAEVLGRPAAGR